ncbi:ArnT family glycosyltransferase [Agrobacterium larrymoorei]|uniref:Glycosyltransferase family 39 protein n=1 Tax=Agrobacterium larrymoorei TaxID=160699 RepID=A0AAF0KJ88_9HYPH|nr:glycosyltransferase family 39 protein [Agrobacterium larrymoorei]WHA41999.1 glycosyltransferase family 39 protein [Agrobacterium larrymoorei]
MTDVAGRFQNAKQEFSRGVESTQWVRLALISILLVTALRILGLAFNRTDLFVDEAQYWLWGRELAFGAYSKPPLIGWIIRFTTWISGGEGNFQVRLAAPAVHAFAAAAMLYLGRMIYDARLGALAAMTYLTLPGVSLSSLLISTDTPMMLFILLSLIFWRKLAGAKAAGASGIHFAIGLGLAVGLGFLSKYAMAFLFPLVPLAAYLDRQWRIRWSDAILAGLVSAAVVAPNLWWNYAHDFATARHTVSIAHWDGLRFKIGSALEFFGAQAGVVGPCVFIAMLAALWQLKTERARALAALSIPLILFMTVQALISRAFANWAVGAYAAGILLAIPWMAARPHWMRASLILNTVVAIILPLLTIFGTELRLPNGELALKRYLGRSALVSTAISDAERLHATVLVASDRSFLAEMFYQLKSGHRIAPRAWNEGAQPPSSHYALLYPLRPGEEKNALYLSRIGSVPDCLKDQQPVSRWVATAGFMEGNEIGLWKIPSSCIERAENGT